MTKAVRISSRSKEIIHEMSLLKGKAEIEIVEAALEFYQEYEKMRLLKKSYQQFHYNAQKKAPKPL